MSLKNIRESLLTSYPNQLTVFRIFLTPLFAFVLTFDEMSYKYVSLAIFVLASVTDWYDGYIARKSNCITAMGKYLDPLADKLLISTAFGIFAYLNYVRVWMFVVMALRDFIITAIRSYAISTNKSFTTSNMAKWKTACQMATIYLIFIWLIVNETYAEAATKPAILTNIKNWNIIWNLMLLVTIFTVYTGVRYLYDNWSHLKSLAIAFYRVFVPTNVR